MFFILYSLKIGNDDRKQLELAHEKIFEIRLLVEIPDDLEIELVKPLQAEKNIIMDPDKKMTMTVDKLAEELQISNTTIYTMVRRNEIPHKKVRGVFYFIGLL